MFNKCECRLMASGLATVCSSRKNESLISLSSGRVKTRIDATIWMNCFVFCFLEAEMHLTSAHDPLSRSLCKSYCSFQLRALSPSPAPSLSLFYSSTPSFSFSLSISLVSLTVDVIWIRCYKPPSQIQSCPARRAVRSAHSCFGCKRPSCFHGDAGSGPPVWDI